MKKEPLFYGWYIVAASVLLMVCNSGILMFGFTAFITPIAMATGWSYAQISLATSLRGLESGALSPLLGAAVDRWPARRLVLTGILIYGLGLFLVSRSNSLASFYIFFVITAFGSSLAVQMVPPTMVARWFRKNVGKATGILAMGNGAGGLMIPLLVILIDTYGWQMALVILAIGLCAIGIPLSFVFRNRPEEYGLLPDGRVKEKTEKPEDSPVSDFSVGAKGALRMRAFWFTGIANVFQVAAASTIVVHLMPYLTSVGLERTYAGMITMLVPLFSLASRIPFGLMMDKFPKKYVMALSIGLISIGAFLFWLIDGSSVWLMVLFAIAFGFGLGGFMPVRVPIYREYFGPRRFATIFGLLSVFNTIGMIAGPPLAGWVFDTRGDYGPTWLILSVIAMAGAVIVLFLPLPPGEQTPITDSPSFG